GDHGQRKKAEVELEIIDARQPGLVDHFTSRFVIGRHAETTERPGKFGQGHAITLRSAERVVDSAEGGNDLTARVQGWSHKVWALVQVFDAVGRGRMNIRSERAAGCEL